MDLGALPWDAAEAVLARLSLREVAALAASSRSCRSLAARLRAAEAWPAGGCGGAAVVEVEVGLGLGGGLGEAHAGPCDGKGQREKEEVTRGALEVVIPRATPRTAAAVEVLCEAGCEGDWAEGAAHEGGMGRGGGVGQGRVDLEEVEQAHVGVEEEVLVAGVQGVALGRAGGCRRRAGTTGTAGDSESEAPVEALVEMPHEGGDGGAALRGPHCHRNRSCIKNANTDACGGGAGGGAPAPGAPLVRAACCEALDARLSSMQGLEVAREARERTGLASGHESGPEGSMACVVRKRSRYHRVAVLPEPVGTYNTFFSVHLMQLNGSYLDVGVVPQSSIEASGSCEGHLSRGSSVLFDCCGHLNVKGQSRAYGARMRPGDTVGCLVQRLVGGAHRVAFFDGAGCMGVAFEGVLAHRPGDELRAVVHMGPAPECVALPLVAQPPAPLPRLPAAAAALLAAPWVPRQDAQNVLLVAPCDPSGLPVRVKLAAAGSCDEGCGVATIDALRGTVANAVGVTKAQLQLLWEGREIAERRKLAELGIDASSTVYFNVPHLTS